MKDHDSANAKQVELLRQEQASVAVRHEPTNMLQAVLEAVKDPKMDPARLREFLEIGERLEARQAKKDFDEAMRQVQDELPVIDKQGRIMYKTGPGPKYAKWDDIHQATKPILSRHGLSVSFTSDMEGPGALRVTIRVKGYGHEEQGSIVVPWLDTGGSKSPAQQAASSFTLAQRHAFTKFFNVLTSEQDDDGSGRGVPDKITEEQVMRIGDILMACEAAENGFRLRFFKWLKAEIQAEKVSDLFQGDQLRVVMDKLKAKMEDLRIA